ncbi:MAG: hypothetical protein QOI63_160 [Thermoplasmata archaeon]|jgi:hypothetical protein|nr:hypothetical protein [Thermoplasmata archaeon]
MAFPMPRILLPALLMVIASLAGCAGSDTGTFTLHATDAPDDIGDFSALTVTVTSIDLTMKGGGVTSYAPSSSTFDLTKLTSGNTTTLFHDQVKAGNYTRLELKVQDASGILKAGGKAAAVKAPSGTLFVLQDFTVAAGRETTFTFDLQVHMEGNGSYIFKPNAGGSHLG